jgi:hypothetical protein
MKKNLASQFTAGFKRAFAQVRNLVEPVTELMKPVEKVSKLFFKRLHAYDMHV